MIEYMVSTKDGRRVKAKHIRHLATTTPPIGNDDIDEVELPDGRRIAVASPRNDGRATPRECGSPADYR